MIKLKFAAVIASIAFMVFSCETKVDIAAEKENLLQTDRDFAANSLEVGAADAFNMYLDQNAMQMPEGRYPVIGRDSIYEGMSKSKGKYTLGWSPMDGEVSSSGDMGWTWGVSVLSWKDKDGVDQQAHGKYLNVWKKQADGSWKVLVDIGNDNPTPEDK